MEASKHDGQIQLLYQWLSGCGNSIGEKVSELFNFACTRAPSLFVKYQLNMDLNRFDDFMCFDRHRVVLTDGGQSYIHANEVQLPRVTYVLTQAPLAHTILDFWRMIWQIKANVIVSLSEPVSVAERFCPTEENDLHHRCGPLYSIRGNVLPAHSNENWKTVEQTLSFKNSQTTTVRYIHFKKWESDKSLPDTGMLLQLVRDVKDQADAMHEKVCGSKLARLKKPPPIVAVCPTGAVRCGLLAAADSVARVIDDPESKTVDISSVVKTLRSTRYGTIPTVQQYVALHKVATKSAREKGISGADEAISVLRQVSMKIGKPSK